MEYSEQRHGEPVESMTLANRPFDPFDSLRVALRYSKGDKLRVTFAGVVQKLP